MTAQNIKLLGELDQIIEKIKTIEIQLRKHADDQDKVRSLAKQLGELL